MTTDQSEHWKPLHALPPGTVFRTQEGAIFTKASPHWDMHDGKIMCMSCDNGNILYFHRDTPCWPLVLGGYREGST